MNYKREARPGEWRSGDEIYRIRDMSDHHLLISISYLEKLWPKYHELVAEFVSRRVAFKRAYGKGQTRKAPRRKHG